QAEADARTWREAGGHVDGQLATLVEWLSGVQASFPPHDLRRARLVMFAADHGIAEAGVSARPAGSTNIQAADVAAGADPYGRLAQFHTAGPGVGAAGPAGSTNIQAADVAAGADPYGRLAQFTTAGLRVVDVGLIEPVRGIDTRVARRGTGRIDRENALTAEAAEGAVRAGASVADEEIDGGADLLLAAALGVGGSTAAATVISIVTGIEPAKVVGRGSGIYDNAWMRK